jgi:hypothetical protein
LSVVICSVQSVRQFAAEAADERHQPHPADDGSEPPKFTISEIKEKIRGKLTPFLRAAAEDIFHGIEFPAHPQVPFAQLFCGHFGGAEDHVRGVVFPQFEVGDSSFLQQALLEFCPRVGGQDVAGHGLDPVPGERFRPRSIPRGREE